jgi:hypothetical protein
LKELGDQWWLRWQLAMGALSRADQLRTLPKYAALGCLLRGAANQNRRRASLVFRMQTCVVYDCG